MCTRVSAPVMALMHCVFVFCLCLSVMAWRPWRKDRMLDPSRVSGAMAAYRAGEYDVILKLVRMLSHGASAKAEVSGVK